MNKKILPSDSYLNPMPFRDSGINLANEVIDLSLERGVFRQPGPTVDGLPQGSGTGTCTQFGYRQVGDLPRGPFHHRKSGFRLLANRGVKGDLLRSRCQRRIIHGRPSFESAVAFCDAHESAVAGLHFLTETVDNSASNMNLIRLFPVAAGCLMLTLGARGQEFEARIFTNHAGMTIPYRLLVPQNYTKSQKYPLVLFLHGAGERGTNNSAQLVHGTKLYLDPVNRAKYPAFVLAPQCPEGKKWVDIPWDTDRAIQPREPSAPMILVLELLDQLPKEFSLDKQRVYVTGLSMGGFGTWDLITRYPNRFAAGAPVCGGGDDTVAVRAARVPIWAFHSDDDATVKVGRTRDMISAIQRAGGRPRYYEYTGLGHNSWDKAYSEPNFLPWLFAQRLGRLDTTIISGPRAGKSRPAHPAPAPLFRDPVHDGAADPTLIWNRKERCWWMLYTNRRADADNEKGVKWVHGTDIGIASTSDGGTTWNYRGIARGLEFEAGRNTFWAPEVVYHEGRYHAFISYVRGVPETWAGTRDILHYTSANLLDWKFESVVVPGSIDACVHRLPNGSWRMWFKNEQKKIAVTTLDSPDLYHWKTNQSEMPDPDPNKGEGPEVFFWRDYFWMVKDMWKGLGVYRSPDADHWEFKGVILDKPGLRPGDHRMGQHPGVLLQDADHAYLIYFVHQAEREPASRHTWLQAVQLGFDGSTLICDRDIEFDFQLRKPTPKFTSEQIPQIKTN
jgi:poly(3-hydroxybutyrate) depolymerase